MADFDKAFGKTGAGNEEEMNRKKDLKELTQTVRLKSGCKAKFDNFCWNSVITIFNSFILGSFNQTRIRLG